MINKIKIDLTEEIQAGEMAESVEEVKQEAEAHVSESAIVKKPRESESATEKYEEPKGEFHDSPLAKGLPSNWSIEPPEVLVRRKTRSF